MNINLTQKETMLLKDQKSHEEMCIKKYNAYANQAKDPQLKQLFKQIASQEQQHLDSINQLLNGQIPNTNQQQGQQQQMSSGQQYMSDSSMDLSNEQSTNSMSSGDQYMSNSGNSPMTLSNATDADLCQDLLTTEKYVSGTYDTTIFEFTNTNARQVLNHIQKEEQEHGEQIFKYMEQNGMYQVQ